MRSTKRMAIRPTKPASVLLNSSRSGSSALACHPIPAAAPCEVRRPMDAPEADLTGWTASPFTAEGITHDVYRKGSGRGVVLIPEIPGIHPGVLALGNYLVDNGFSVASPSLFGEPGRPLSAGYLVPTMARACV